MTCPELLAAWQRSTGGPSARSCGPYLRHARGCSICSNFARSHRDLRRALRAAARAEDAAAVLPEDLVRQIVHAIAAAAVPRRH